MNQMEVKHMSQVTELNNNIIALHNRIEEINQNHDANIQVLKLEYQAQVEAQVKELTKRNTLARGVISEKEEEVKALSSKIKELQLEIASGAPGERKILALAELQSKRDLHESLKKYEMLDVLLKLRLFMCTCIQGNT